LGLAERIFDFHTARLTERMAREGGGNPEGTVPHEKTMTSGSAEVEYRYRVQISVFVYRENGNVEFVGRTKPFSLSLVSPVDLMTRARNLAGRSRESSTEN